MHRRRYIRSSLRSKGSSLSDVDPRERIKDCCRKFVAFMCTQVGVGGLVVCYTLIGALGFSRIESEFKDEKEDEVKEIFKKCASQLWRVAKINNIFNETAFYEGTDLELRNFQLAIVRMVKKGYDDSDPEEMWSFSAALMFSLSIITMIGYGNLVPRTKWGKLATVVYAVFGIPLYVLYFLNMGEVLAGCFRWVYTWLYECSRKKSDNEPPRRVIVPSTACLWVIGGYILTGSIMFAKWEQWSFLDSTYFCVTSLCKLGLGDLVPGTASKTGNESKLVINYIYMLVGLGLVAMCFNLMREDIRVKVEELREDFSQCLEDTRMSSSCTMSAKFAGSTAVDGIQRLCNVPGYQGRTNDVLYCSPNIPTLEQRSQEAVVYFGGDIQDFSENMKTSKENSQYLQWSLENTVQILHTGFPDCHIIVIRPSKVEHQTFSCFENFVPGGKYGVPKYAPAHCGLHHLQCLLTDIFSTVSKPIKNQPTDLNLNESRLKLVGFSKGCVVLNQFLYEFHFLKDQYSTTNKDSAIEKFVSRIGDMYWLDGGHCGKKETWITSPKLLQTLCEMDISIHIHVTPYQIEDDRRPWIKKEESIFHHTLSTFRGRFQRRIHNKNKPRSLESHFNVLTTFYSVCDSYE